MDIQKAIQSKQKDDAFSVRRVVFIHEQKVPESLEMDEHDESAHHFVGYDENIPVAAGRLRVVEDYGKLERICVIREHRGRHFGQAIISRLEEYTKELGFHKTKLNAQTHAEDFYKSLGYETISDTFIDAGIPHVTMVKHLN
ncbi:GNAT family N-acetyltransferase [Halobacillus locisalis]|uniref:GNAT family N-acetyltransferase n=1 Tax=Halobacillus locisalis TaxID=220753 RepID=A0A838CRL5_9BACI|nr:GNAT family N-acetyltransferase [Halobacillus locisalis]MBA2174459.1 GNAT family N-acetyltransferase [Halobacillus locisalis]